MQKLNDEQQRALRFFQLLISVSTRELTSEAPTSDVRAKGFLDKLEGYFRKDIFQEQIKKNASELGYKVTEEGSKSKKSYLVAADAGSSLKAFRFRKYYEDRVTHLESNPAHFDSSAEYLEALSSLIHPLQLKDIKVSRMDLACDYELPFRKVLGGLDQRFKQTRSEYRNGTLTGVYFGRGDEKILAYDKQIQSELPDPRTRIEIQLRRKKLHISSFAEFADGKSLLFAISGRNPFKEIELFNVLPVKIDERISKFMTLVETSGFHAAKQQFNQQGNFQRDIGKHLSKERLTPQPSEVLLTGLKAFFSKENAHEKSNHLRPSIVEGARA